MLSRVDRSRMLCRLRGRRSVLSRVDKSRMLCRLRGKRSVLSRFERSSILRAFGRDVGRCDLKARVPVGHYGKVGIVIHTRLHFRAGPL